MNPMNEGRKESVARDGVGGAVDADAVGVALRSNISAVVGRRINAESER
jgi:hypothetical protein